MFVAPCRASVVADLPGLERRGFGCGGSSGGGGILGLSRLMWVVVSGGGARGFVHVLVARYRAQFAAVVSGLGRRGSCGGGLSRGGGVGLSQLLIVVPGDGARGSARVLVACCRA